MKKIVLKIIVGSFGIFLWSRAMTLEMYEAIHDGNNPASKTILTKRIKKIAKRAHDTILRPETFYHALPRHNKPAQCTVLAHWLRAQPLKKNRESMFGVFLHANKLCSRKQSRSHTFLQREFETHEPLLHALGTIMSCAKYPPNLPIKPFYKFIDNGRQAVLRRKLSAHSSLEPEQIDLLVFTLVQELAHRNSA